MSRPDRLSSAEIAAIVQAAGLQGMPGSFHMTCMEYECTLYLAVRKNRYVILPIDFEEAWKVCCLVLFCYHQFLGYKRSDASFFSTPTIQQTVKRQDDTHEFCTCETFLFYFCSHFFFSRSVVWDVVFLTVSSSSLLAVCLVSDIVF